MEIRAADSIDFAAVVACADLAFAFFPESSGPAEIEPDEQLKEQVLAGAVSVICADDKVLGYISLWAAADHLFIESVAVLPSCHNQGLGSLLLLFAEQTATRLGFGSVRLFTMETMASNFAFYKHRGYHETGRCNDDGFSRVFYRKDLASAPLPGSAHVETRNTFTRWVAGDDAASPTWRNVMPVDHLKHPTRSAETAPVSHAPRDPGRHEEAIPPRISARPRSGKAPSESDLGPTTRFCLRCRESFQSAWAGERICRRCKSTNAWRSNAIK